KMERVQVIGSGFSSLSAACYLAQAGYKVDVFEKNSTLGGRARAFSEEGFTFDMGPSWYWMPDVFEKFFADFGKKPSDYYELVRLTPAYKVFYKEMESIEVPSSIEAIYDLFESIEPGSAVKLEGFIKSAENNYKASMDELVYRPGKSVIELVTPQTVTRLNQFFSTIRATIKRDFANPKLIKILEFPVLFLGAKPEKTPAFYNFMNYADFVLGTWYPMGGMYKIVEAMVRLAEDLGVRFHTNANIDEIIVQKRTAVGISVNGENKYADMVLSGADYHHTEKLLPLKYRMYNEEYWQSRTFAPSALIFYVGFDKKLDNVRHHNLFFDEDFDQHAVQIYDTPEWPDKPLFYTCFPSITDPSVAPIGKENAFFLIPIAPGIEDTESKRKEYFNIVMTRLESLTGQSLIEHVVYKKSFCVADFKSEYNSYKGNAYGMANTLKQTAFLRPKIKSKKVGNLFFTGQLTVPGPGVPPALISGKISAEQVTKQFTNELKFSTI
ncbi:MAG: phytoene desaturase, partial [Bacteroidia bacterium]